MRSKLLPSLLLGLLPRVTAVFKDEVDDIDFHYPLLGLPQTETTFFHRPRKDDKASLLYTLSDLGLLGAVNPSNGGLVWRHQLGPAVGDDYDDDNSSRAAFLRAPEGEECVVSAYGSGVQAWNALTGRSLWHINFNGRVRDLKILELSESSRKDVLALFEEDGTTVLRRLHGLAGTVFWEFRETSKDVPLHVSNDIANVYVVSLHGSTSSYNLKVTSLETATGARVNHWMLGNKGDIHHAGDVLLAGTNSAAPIIGWAKQGLAKLSVNVLGRKSTQELALPPDTISMELHAPHLAQSQPHFLVHVQMKKKSDEGEKSHKAMVYHTNLKTGQVKLAYELPAFKGEGVFATSSDEANVYFAQIDSDETRIFSSESHGLLAKWPNCRAADISPVDAVTEVIKKADGRDFAVRSAIVTKAGDWVLLRNGDRDWTRHEGLSSAVAAVWVEIAEGEDLAKVLAEEAHTNPLSAYIHRVKRHFDDLKHIPGSLASVTERFVKSMTGGEAVSNRDGVLRRDSFGFNKILVLVTRRGRLYGIDSGNHGKIIWTRSWWPLDTDGHVRIKGLAADDARGVVSVYESGGSYAAFNASSGAIIEMIEAAGEDSRVSSTAVIDDELGRKLFAVGRDGLPLRPLPASWDADQTIIVRGEDQTLRGVKFTSRGGKTTRQEAWQLPMRPGLKIVQVATLPSHDPVASIGRVLGDRGVLYKYLNANSMVMAAADVTAHTLSVQLVDMSSGQLLASQLYRGVDSRQAISCAMAENWYACSFFGDYSLNDQTGRAIKGYQVAVTDLYESPEPNSRGPLGEAANLSATAPVDSPTGGMPLPWTVSQAYVLSQPLTKLAVTQTRQGISTRELVGYLPEAHGIAGLSRHALDPRRPVGRDPTAADMEAEALARYAPALEIDGRMVLSHKRDVAGVAALVPAPALVESTGLLAAYGVDVYVTRVAPSGVFDILGKGFNKATLVATVVALIGGVLFLAPMVRRKQIDRRWEGFL